MMLDIPNRNVSLPTDRFLDPQFIKVFCKQQTWTVNGHIIIWKAQGVPRPNNHVSTVCYCGQDNYAQIQFDDLQITDPNARSIETQRLATTGAEHTNRASL